MPSIGYHTQVFGMVTVQNNLFVASSCTEKGGVFCYKQTDPNVSGTVEGTWESHPDRLLATNTANCAKVHGLAFLQSQGSIVFTDISLKIVKTIFLSKSEVHSSVRILSRR